ncbi:MAG: tryptophan halogenase family protein [Sphingomicrobium sp.]
MSEAGPIRRIVIVGGGTAGWMAAAALARFVGAGRRIVVVESEAIGTVGVGEGTIPPVNEFNIQLGIPEAEFVRATKASYKLGIDFVNWVEDGQRYFHQFGDIGRAVDGVPLYQLWLKHRRSSGVGPLSNYSISAVTAGQFRFSRPNQDPSSPLSGLAYAYHFDASLYGQFLRRYAEARGAERIEGKIVSVDRDGESGDVTAVRLEGDRVVKGDLFVDCSGFRSLLLGQTMEVPFEDWSHWLPCDRAIAVPCERVEPLTPFTRSTARPAGWQWRIPLQHRTGNGHVYCSAHMGEDEAEQLLLDNLDGAQLAATNKLRFTAGRRVRSWEGNVVAIGLAAGFLEPLESTSIHLIQRGIQKLISLFPSSGINPVERAEYNRLLAESYDPIRDFIILHYKATRRSGPFWDHVREMAIPDSLQHKFDLFREHGRIFRYNDELFDVASWAAVMIGQEIFPEAAEPMLSNYSDAQALGALAELHTAYEKAAGSLPTHAAYLERLIASA